MAAEVAAGKPTVALAVVGLRDIGLAFAEQIIEAGYTLVVADRTPGRDGTFAERGATRLDLAGETAPRARRRASTPEEQVIDVNTTRNTASRGAAGA